MGLIIALDDNGKASGELFWDDGESRGTLCQTFVRMCIRREHLSLVIVETDSWSARLGPRSRPSVSWFPSSCFDAHLFIRIECTQVSWECCDLTSPFFFSYFTETVENGKYVHYNFIVENVSFTSVNPPSSKSTPTLWSELKFKVGNHQRLETFPVRNTGRDWSMLRCWSFVGSTTSCCCSSQHWGLLCMFDVWWRCSSCTRAPGVQREKSIRKAAWQMHTSFLRAGKQKLTFCDNRK